MERGKIILAGGEISAKNNPIYEKFLASCGNETAQVAIVSAASCNPQKSFGDFSNVLFLYGLKENQIAHISLNNSLLKTEISLLNKCNLIWFVGGDQNKLYSALMNNQKVLYAIKLLHNKGVTIAGTSAGAAILTKTMIGGGSSYCALLGVKNTHNIYTDESEFGGLLLSDGIGFIHKIIADQHFNAKGRIGRLAVVITMNPNYLGVGIDEDTAILVDLANSTFEVIGRNGVTILGAKREVSNSDLMKIENIKLHYLSEYDMFDYENRRVLVHQSKRLTTGNEFFTKHQTIASGVANANNSLIDLLSYGLIDNKLSNEVRSFCFEAENVGFELVFTKDSFSEGYFSKINGLERYSIKNVLMSIYPVNVKIDRR